MRAGRVRSIGLRQHAWVSAMTMSCNESRVFTAKHGQDIDWLTLEIATPRLRLSSISRIHAGDIFREFTLEITQYMAPSPADTIDDTFAFIDAAVEMMKAGDNYQAVVLRSDSGEFLGCCGLHGKGKPETPELGIWIKTEAHGNGYGKEAIIGLKRWADSNLAYKYLTYPVDRRNQASLRIPEALGGEVFGREAQKKVDGTT